MNMRTEPIRLPAWAATLLTVLAIPVATAYLTGISVKQALATALAALVPLLVAGEVSRRKVDAPATVRAKVKAARQRKALP